MELACVKSYNCNVIIDMGSKVDDIQEQYVHSVLDKLEAFVEDVWQSGMDDNLDEAWILTALLHSSAQIASAVAVDLQFVDPEVLGNAILEYDILRHNSKDNITRAKMPVAVVITARIHFAEHEDFREHLLDRPAAGYAGYEVRSLR